MYELERVACSVAPPTCPGPARDRRRSLADQRFWLIFRAGSAIVVEPAEHFDRKATSSMDIPALEKSVSAHLPEQFLAAVVKSVFLARQMAHEACRAEFDDTEVLNVEPFFLRGKVESLLRDAAKLHKGLSTSVVNSSGWNHTEISAGPIVLTAHAVDNPCAMVHDAMYRKSLAESQASFFDPAEHIPGARLYALLIHSPFNPIPGRGKKEFGYLPGSVYLAFPEAALKRYAHAINLYDKFPDLIESLLPKEWDEKARLAYRWRARQRTA